MPRCDDAWEHEWPAADLMTSRVTVRQYFGDLPLSAAGWSEEPISWDPPTVRSVHGEQAYLRFGRQPVLGATHPDLVRQLYWHERGETIVVTASGSDRLDRLPSDAELLRVADGLHWD